MGLAQDIDSLLKKDKEVGLDEPELAELKGLWEAYEWLNALYGVKIPTFEELMEGICQ